MKAKHPKDNVEIAEEEVTDEIFTVSNVITFIRLCMVPLFMVLLLGGANVTATVVFAVAACTDFVDGQIARRTNTVSKLGRLLDPAVDRLLMIFGVLGLLLVGRLPLWMVAFVVIRDLYTLIGGMVLLKHWKVRVPVIYAGKFATTFLFVGFALLLLNAPLVPGLGLVDFDWLPGFNAATCSAGIWFVYAGLVLSIFTTIYYTVCGIFGIQGSKEDQLSQEEGC
ncbi:MAG: CDP-alcohol phosphatidyltransferase family protein [Eggerthellales bacterium]|nr:CDP-alcohol phosphatidyltransferase family protein [Eggerthellales bacterium]